MPDLKTILKLNDEADRLPGRMGFIFGSLAVGFSNGGLGAYPFSIALIFSLYGITKDVGTAFGWLVWTSQTILTILLGLISYVLLPVLNRNK